MPAKMYLACGASVVFLVASFFLGGFHHEIKHRLRERRRGGYFL